MCIARSDQMCAAVFAAALRFWLLHPPHLRILCSFMMLGQATGTAAALAIDEEIPVQDLNYPQLQSRLKQDGLILELPENAHWDGKKKIKY